MADNETILREALEWYAEPTRYAVPASGYQWNNPGRCPVIRGRLTLWLHSGAKIRFPLMSWAAVEQNAETIASLRDQERNVRADIAMQRDGPPRIKFTWDDGTKVDIPVAAIKDVTLYDALPTR